MLITVGATAAPTMLEIAVRNPMSAMAEASTTTRCSSVSSDRSGSPREPTSAPGTSGGGRGNSTSAVIVSSAFPARSRATPALNLRPC